MRTRTRRSAAPSFFSHIIQNKKLLHVDVSILTGKKKKKKKWTTEFELKKKRCSPTSHFSSSRFDHCHGVVDIAWLCDAGQRNGLVSTLA